MSILSVSFLIVYCSCIIALTSGYDVFENSIFWVEKLWIFSDYPKMASAYERIGFQFDNQNIYKNIHLLGGNPHHSIDVKVSISRPTKRSDKKTFPLYLSSSRLHFSSVNEEFPGYTYKAIQRSNYKIGDAFSVISEYEALNHFALSLETIAGYLASNEDYKNYKIAIYIKDLKMASLICKFAMELLMCSNRVESFPKFTFFRTFLNTVINASNNDNYNDNSDWLDSSIDDFMFELYEQVELVESITLVNPIPIEIVRNYLKDTFIPLIIREHASPYSLFKRYLDFPLCQINERGGYTIINNLIDIINSKSQDKQQNLDADGWLHNATFNGLDSKLKIGFKTWSDDDSESEKVLQLFSPHFEIVQSISDGKPSEITCKDSSNGNESDDDNNGSSKVCEIALNRKYLAVAGICPLYHLQSKNENGADLALEILSSYSNFNNIYPIKCRELVHFRQLQGYNENSVPLVVADRSEVESYLYIVLWSMVVTDSADFKSSLLGKQRLNKKNLKSDLPFNNFVADLYNYGIPYGNSNRYKLGGDKELNMSFVKVNPKEPIDDAKVMLFGLGAGRFHALLSAAFPRLYIDSVEANSDIFKAARALKFNGVCDVLSLQSNKEVSVANDYNVSGLGSANSDYKCRSRVILADYLSYFNHLKSTQKMHNIYNYVFVDMVTIDFFRVDLSEDVLRGQGSICDQSNCNHVDAVHNVLINNQGFGIWHFSSQSDYKDKLLESIESKFGSKNMIMFKSSASRSIIVAGKNVYHSNSLFNFGLNIKAHPCANPLQAVVRASDIFSALDLHEHAFHYKYALDCNYYEEK